MGSHRHITDREIEDGLETVALLIKRYGDVYWPVFERLEQELEMRHSRADRLKMRLRKTESIQKPKLVAVRR